MYGIFFVWVVVEFGKLLIVFFCVVLGWDSFFVFFGVGFLRGE